MSHFKKALAFVLRMEGGYVNDPADHGGATMRGITQAVYNKYRDAMGSNRRAVRDIHNSELEWIYYHWYWCRAKCDDIVINDAPDLALAHMDWSVNTGPARAARHLQEVVGVTVDGIIGPVTLARCNDDLIPKYLFKRLGFYVAIVSRDRSQEKFLRTWLWRVVELSKLLYL